MHRKSDSKKAKYIIRFDDLSPEMNVEIWEKIETLLYKYKIKPIIAVVPHNEDERLKCNDYDPNFWIKIKQYQDDGFMVALHGYNHVYINHKSGLLGISANSEFVGLPFEQQKDRINAGLKIFKDNHINADAFIAPSHSFNNATLKALDGSIKIISDGLLRNVYKYKNYIWIPCQMWDSIKPKDEGIFTVCFHHNNWTSKNLESFENDLIKYNKYIINPFDLVCAENLSFCKLIEQSFLSIDKKIKRFIKKVIHK